MLYKLIVHGTCTLVHKCPSGGSNPKRWLAVAHVLLRMTYKTCETLTTSTKDFHKTLVFWGGNTYETDPSFGLTASK